MEIELKQGSRDFVFQIKDQIESIFNDIKPSNISKSNRGYLLLEKHTK